MIDYLVRPGPFRRETAWRLADGALVEAPLGKTERLWPLASLRTLRIATGTNRYVPDETVMRLTFRKGAVNIGSYSFRRIGDYEDQGSVFTGFVRAVCAEAARIAPAARFEAGQSRAVGVFTGAMVLMGVGVVMLIGVALSAGFRGLGLDLAARLAFGLLLMIAAQPWVSGAGTRRFDPLAPSPRALAGGRP